VISPDLPRPTGIGWRIVAARDPLLLDQARTDMPLRLEIVDEPLGEPVTLGEEFA